LAANPDAGGEFPVSFGVRELAAALAGASLLEQLDDKHVD
jgi:hypothetical protein